jgi:hypothetical protein
LNSSFTSTPSLLARTWPSKYFLRLPTCRYVANLNAATAKLAEAQAAGNVTGIIQCQQAIKFNGNSGGSGGLWCSLCDTWFVPPPPSFNVNHDHLEPLRAAREHALGHAFVTCSLGGGHLNHSIFWENLAPPTKGGGGAPDGELAALINAKVRSTRGAQRFLILPWAQSSRHTLAAKTAKPTCPRILLPSGHASRASGSPPSARRSIPHLVGHFTSSTVWLRPTSPLSSGHSRR